MAKSKTEAIHMKRGQARYSDHNEHPQYTPTQIRKRMRQLDNLRDIRATGAVWHAATSELNENGRDMMKRLHSPIATLQGVYCHSGFGPKLRKLVREYLRSPR